MPAFTADSIGTGAMLVRLLGIGARSGLTAETTLLHVLDGVPLPQETLVIPRLTPEALETLRQAGPGAIVPVSDCGAGEEDDEDDLPDGLDADAIEGELGPDCWNGPSWMPAKGSKADRALDLWSTTQIDVVEIATRLGSTPGAIRSIVKKARARGEPRAQRPRVEMPTETVAAIEQAKALPLKRDRAILLWARTDLRPRDIAGIIGSTPPAVSFYMKVARREKHPDVLAGDERRGFKAPVQPQAAPPSENLPEGASEGPRSQVQILPGTSVASEGAPVAQSGRAGQNGDAGSNPAREASLSDSSAVRAPSHSPEEAPPCAEPVEEPSTRRLDDGAIPAPPPVQDPEEKGTVRQEPIEAATSVVETAPDTADRPAGPGLNSAPADQAIDAMVAGLAKKSEPDARLEKLLELYAGTTRQQKDIGAELGLSEWKVSTLIKAARATNDSRIVAGDAARAALKATDPAAPPVKVAATAPPAPAPASQKAAAPKAAPAAKPSDQPPGDLVALKHDQVLAVDRGWIIGPAGSVKGFPLIAGVLATLAAGELLPAKLVAQRSGARSGEAVLQMLQFWRDDLGRIGVEVVRVGTADVRLRRKEA